jgi:hypothetical protein
MTLSCWQFAPEALLLFGEEAPKEKLRMSIAPALEVDGPVTPGIVR